MGFSTCFRRRGTFEESDYLRYRLKYLYPGFSTCAGTGHKISFLAGFDTMQSTLAMLEE